MVGLRAQTAFHTGVDEYGRPLTAAEREKLLAPILPSEPLSQPKSSSQSQKSKGSKKRVRHLVRNSCYALVFHVIQIIFSIYIRIRRAYRNVLMTVLGILYHHHRTPELIQRDVKDLSKIPKHLSIILDLGGQGRDAAELERLVNDACECAAWSACAGVSVLSIYERTGYLKSSLPQLHRKISSTLSSYFGADSPSRPTISLRAPSMPAFSPPSSMPDLGSSARRHLSITLLSASDGRHTLVDLTKTLTEMSQKHKLAPEDISTELIDAEISESVMQEPDLLILFGDSVVLQGYPPWQIRLSEIFHVPDNTGVSYPVFLQGLRKFAGAQMRFGS